MKVASLQRATTRTPRNLRATNYNPHSPTTNPSFSLDLRDISLCIPVNTISSAHFETDDPAPRASPPCELLTCRPYSGRLSADHFRRESFDNIHLDLSKQAGKCKLAESGLGWRPSGGGDTFTLDSSNIGAAQWSRAAKGFELKILSRTSGVIQLDGFDQEVCTSAPCDGNEMTDGVRSRISSV